jgi:hypothetical protein
MQDENNREPTDAQKADMVLRGHMLSLCSPLWWESERKFVVHSGSMCVVKTPKAVFGIAKNHVFEQYQKDKADKKDVFCQLASVSDSVNGASRVTRCGDRTCTP